jgi:hypothetical protein
MRGRTTMKQEAGRSMMSKDALPSLDASLPGVLADLEGLGIEGLRRQWRNHLGGDAPTHLPRWLFLSVLGHRLQTAAFGDIDKATRRMIQGEGERGARAQSRPNYLIDTKKGQARPHDWLLMFNLPAVAASLIVASLAPWMISRLR